MAYIHKVISVGRSRCVVLPKNLCKALRLNLGDHVEITLAAGGVVHIRKLETGSRPVSEYKGRGDAFKKYVGGKYK